MQCRYLNVLDQVDIESVGHLTASHKRRQTMRQKNEIQLNKEPKMKLEIEVEIDQIQLSTIVALKKLFRKYPGRNDVHVHYHLSDDRVGTLEVTEPWGVDVAQEFLAKLKQIQGIREVQIEGRLSF